MARLRVSVIISTYNRADLLPEAIDCLLTQTRVPDEIIVVDDGSTDDTPAVLASYPSPVIAIRQSNKGLAAGRNTGLRRATGDLIAFLDSDDILTPDSIEKRALVFEQNPQVNVVYSDLLATDMANKPYGPWPGRRPSGDVFVEAARYNLMPIHSYMLRRECLEQTGPFDETLRSNEHFDFWIRVAAHYPFHYLDEPLAFYRFHDNMMTVVKHTEMRPEWLLVQRRVYEMDAFQALSSRQKSIIYCSHGNKIMRGFPREARWCFWQGVRVHPTGLRAYLLLTLSLLGKNAFIAVHDVYRRRHSEMLDIRPHPQKTGR